jgi:hypothetical protein
MIKRFKVYIAALLCAVCMFAPSLPAAAAAVDVFHDACTTAGASKSSACSNNGSNPLTGKTGLLSKITSIISYLAGISAVLLIIISGFMYVTANGDSSKLNTARTTIIYAVVGLIIVLLAQTIIIFVINKV